MCEHKWILLTTARYERSVWEEPSYASDVRGCPTCGVIEFRNSLTANAWQVSHIVGTGDDQTNTKLGGYIKSLETFVGANAANTKDAVTDEHFQYNSRLRLFMRRPKRDEKHT